MTGIKWKQQVNRDGDKVENCWVTECKYTVARCFVGSAERYMVTAPGERAPFAYTPSKGEILKIIINHKQAQN